MKLIAILRIKDSITGLQIINDCLKNLSVLVDEIVIVDNGSSPKAFSLYKKYPKITVVRKTHGFDEGKDRNLALNLARSRFANWILWIDADEVFERTVTRKDLEIYMNDNSLNKVNFRLFHFWLQTEKFRIDNRWLYYTSRPVHMMWRDLGTAYFKDTKFHGGYIAGVEGKETTSIFRLKHLGYISRANVLAKSLLYSRIGKKETSSAKKTLSLDPKENTTLVPFREFKYDSYYRLYLHLEKVRWDIIEKFEGIGIYIRKQFGCDYIAGILRKLPY